VIDRLARYNLKPVAQEMIKFGDKDFTSQLLKIKEANPEVMVIHAYTNEDAIAIRQAGELGLKAKIIVCFTGADKILYNLAGEAAAGVIVVFPSPALIEDPELEWFQKKISYKDDMTNAYIYQDAYGAASCLVEGLKRAGRNLTRERLVDALETLKNFETGVIRPVTFTKNNHEGIRSASFFTILPGGKRQMLKTVYSEE
jgi:branched-chain amino acid transport system substrate-binding protein